MLLNQSYLSSKEIKLKPYSYNKRSFTLKVTTDKLRSAKQGRALMPNLIHSLDASVLALLADDLFNTNNINNFYSIHDCFAVTANNIPKLFSALKSIYTKIYTQDIFLRNFDNFIRSYIKVKYGDNCFNDDNLKINTIVDDKEVVLQFPNLNQVLGRELPSMDLITKSSYLIS
ncbi:MULTISPECIES: DNA-directed RNA polymerase [Actinomycetes]|uniref:DNA-directed RNA polymerase n=1 Tax=Streptomyces ziwulingensis TaxID=1045501 RepID=A0ABP9D6S5_9ACTN